MFEILGTNQAQDDEHLLDYFIEEQEEFDRPIIVGRWGTGKTSLLLKRTQNIRNYLFDESNPFDTPWYIEEEDLNIAKISEIYEENQSSRPRTYAVFSEMWESEIWFRAIVMLKEIWRKDKARLKSPSWNHIGKSKTTEMLPEGVWRNARLVFDLLSKTDRYTRALDAAFQIYDELRSKNTRKHVFQCISELNSLKIPRPVISIEPIETPFSETENQTDSLANDLVSSLLNCWYQKFRPERIDCNLVVHVSVPWHRYFPGRTSFPDKIPNYTSFVGWTKNRLRNLISKRLVWEMNKSGNEFIMEFEQDFNLVWSKFFPEKIANAVAFNIYDRREDSFDYLCRHTSWRARDLIVLTRECIEAHCKKNKIAYHDYFANPECVDPDLVKSVVSGYSQRTAPSRIEEYVKRNGGGKVSATVFKGLPSPIGKRQIVDTLMKEFNFSGKVKEESLFSELWSAEIIGLAFEFSNNDAKRRFTSAFGVETVRQLVGSEELDNRPLDSVAFLFGYSTRDDWNVNSIMARYENHRIVFHPIFNEYLRIKVRCQYPIGV
jgi:hypothetical protein